MPFPLSPKRQSFFCSSLLVLPEPGEESQTFALLLAYQPFILPSWVLCVCSGKSTKGRAFSKGGWQREVCLLLLARSAVDREREGHVGSDDGGAGRRERCPGKCWKASALGIREPSCLGSHRRCGLKTRSIQVAFSSGLALPDHRLDPPPGQG